MVNSIGTDKNGKFPFSENIDCSNFGSQNQ